MLPNLHVCRQTFVGFMYVGTYMLPNFHMCRQTVVGFMSVGTHVTNPSCVGRQLLG